MHPLLRAHTDGVLNALTTYRDGNADLTFGIGDAAAPPGAKPPYVVVHLLPSGPTDGSLSAPDADGALLYQLSSWGSTREQTEWLADIVRHVLLDEPLAITGRSVMRVAIESSAGVFADEDLGEKPRLFHAPDRYRIYTTPE